jgi:cell division FtsZ-interacting protein ZapD
MLRQAVNDASARGILKQVDKELPIHSRALIRTEALAFLHNAHGDLAYWLDLLGIDLDQVQSRLLDIVEERTNG